ncbi:MAG: hypothetical protein AABX68_01025 [Nanoarchaeota archaeon]
MADRTKALIVILVLIIVVLVGVVTFTFLIKPKVTGYTTNLQIEGANLALTQVLGVVAQCQPFPINVGNQTITLVALECIQAAQQQAQTQQATQ